MARADFVATVPAEKLLERIVELDAIEDLGRRVARKFRRYIESDLLRKTREFDDEIDRLAARRRTSDAKNRPRPGRKLPTASIVLSVAKRFGWIKLLQMPPSVSSDPHSTAIGVIQFDVGNTVDLSAKVPRYPRKIQSCRRPRVSLAPRVNADIHRAIYRGHRLDPSCDCSRIGTHQLAATFLQSLPVHAPLEAGGQRLHQRLQSSAANPSQHRRPAPGGAHIESVPGCHRKNRYRVIQLPDGRIFARVMFGPTIIDLP